ncbi:unnamed protein product [Symbiodinium pilosum]|uniref:sphingolipid 4-desaturase n=1 Tax=Symbiodinium pilosum TaxID=2952 RepID=A0A812RAT8_SYMPI|nr:unnamed protein product [Symbiodinium pilosum]
MFIFNIQTEVPFGNRNRLVWVNGLLPAFASEIARVLRPKGRAALLMTRAHARQMMQLLGTEESYSFSAEMEEWTGGASKKDEDEEEEVEEEKEDAGVPVDVHAEHAPDSTTLKLGKQLFHQHACYKVSVGGWPAAVLVLERLKTDLTSPRAAPETPAARKGKGMKGAGKGQGAEPRECLLIDHPAQSPRRLVDFLMQRWPSHFPTESVSRRAMGRGRVWVQDSKELRLRQAWWSEPMTMQTIVFLPDYPRRSPYQGPLAVLYQDDHVGVVLKEPGLRIFGGARTLANLLTARSPPPLEASGLGDALPSPVPVHFLEAELGGCFLVAKTAQAALGLGCAAPRRRLRALLCGEKPLQKLKEGCDGRDWCIHHSAPSVRFGKVTDASCFVQGPVAMFREECARNGLTVLGDTQYAGENAPRIRRSQVYLFVDSLPIAMGTNKSPEWESVPFKGDRDFFYADNLEPHATRRSEILKKHPEIKALMGPEWKTKYIVVATVALQVFMAYITRSWSTCSFLIAVYVIGATVNHSLFLAIHELAHGLGAKSMMANKLIGMVANLPIVFPYCITFKPYHMAHHRNQGVHGIDTDVPTALEGYLITKSSMNYVDHTLRKAVFMFLQIFAYALRPIFIKPDLVPIDGWVIGNFVVCATFDYLILVTMGWHGVLYLLLSTFFAGSIHPTAGHFIAEHYVMEGEVETYSYYGPLNYLAYNVGYHNEHHDFPNIAWSSLPTVRKLAPEYYDSLPQCPSWPGAILRYIFDDSISPFSRVKRTKKAE